MMRLKKDPAIAAAQFSASIREASRLTGYSERDVTRGMVGSVLKIAAGRTKEATDEKTDKRSRLWLTHKMGVSSTQGGSPVTINAGVRIRKLGPGYIWYCGHSRTGQRYFKLAGQVADDGSAALELAGFSRNELIAVRETALAYANSVGGAKARGRASESMARQSWLQIANAIGIALETVPGRGLNAQGLAKARAAMASNGRAYINGSASESTSGGGKYKVMLNNFLPYALAINLDSLMTSVLAGEANRFNKMHEKGIFDSQTKLARAYPWVKVLGAAPEVPPA